jgi:hypothetical protein
MRNWVILNIYVLSSLMVMQDYLEAVIFLYSQTPLLGGSNQTYHIQLRSILVAVIKYFLAKAQVKVQTPNYI